MVRSGHFIVDPEPYLEEITTNTHGQVRSFYSGPRAIPGGNYNTHGQVRSGHFIVDPEPYLEEITTNTVRSGHFIVDPEPYLEEITTHKVK